LFRGQAQLAAPLGSHMSAPLPTIGAGEAVSQAVDALGATDALLVLDEGKPVGVITRTDLIGYLASP